MTPASSQWDWNSGELISKIEIGSGYVRNLDLSPDGKSLLATSNKGPLLYDLGKPESPILLKILLPVWALSEPHPRSVLAYPKRVAIWNPQTGVVLAVTGPRHADTVYDLAALSPDHRYVASAGGSQPALANRRRLGRRF